MKPYTLRIHPAAFLRFQWIKLMKINFGGQLLDCLFILNGIKADTVKLVTRRTPYQCQG